MRRLCGQDAVRVLRFFFPGAVAFPHGQLDPSLPALPAAHAADPTKIVICQTAPSVRVAIGELFGLGTSDTTPKLVNALRKLGFDYVFGEPAPLCGVLRGAACI